MRSNVPYYSQRTDVTDQAWQSRACGVACVAMVIVYRGGVIKSLDALIEEGREIGAYREGVGWMHDGLVALAGRHGLKLYREEFKDETVEGEQHLEQGIEKIVTALKQGRLVLVSVARGFEDATKPHLVLLTGTEGDEGAITGFYYHDPDADTKEAGMNQFVPLEIFKRFWRRLVIFEAL